MDYLRLITTEVDEDSRCPKGVFAVAYELRNSEDLPPETRQELRELLSWFETNLHSPRDDDREIDGRAIFWFKRDASHLLKRLWEIAQLVRVHGYTVETIRTDRPGYVVYEDDLQVAAVPFRDTTTK
jgi:hypothetical protein